MDKDLMSLVMTGAGYKPDEWVWKDDFKVPPCAACMYTHPRTGVKIYARLKSKVDKCNKCNGQVLRCIHG